MRNKSTLNQFPILFIFSLISILSLVGCETESLENIKPVRDTLYIYTKDSLVITKKDTLFIFKKDTLIISKKDTVLQIQKDTLYVPVNGGLSVEQARNLLIGNWKITHTEKEEYSFGGSGATLISKSIITPITEVIAQYQDNGIIYVPSRGVSTKWNLLSPYYLQQDQGTTNERYYQILVLDASHVVYKGPFKANGSMFTNYLITEHMVKVN